MISPPNFQVLENPWVQIFQRRSYQFDKSIDVCSQHSGFGTMASKQNSVYTNKPNETKRAPDTIRSDGRVETAI